MLLPLPLRPTIPKNSPGAISTLTSSTACSDVEAYAAAERMQRPLLERVVLLVGQPEALAHVLDGDRRSALPEIGVAVAGTLLGHGRAHAADGSNEHPTRVRV